MPRADELLRLTPDVRLSRAVATLKAQAMQSPVLSVSRQPTTVLAYGGGAQSFASCPGRGDEAVDMGVVEALRPGWSASEPRRETGTTLALTLDRQDDPHGVTGAVGMKQRSINLTALDLSLAALLRSVGAAQARGEKWAAG